MKKLTILILLFFMAFQPVLNAQKKVVIVDHDARYKNNGLRVYGHQDNGNHKNRGLGPVKNKKWKKKYGTRVVPGTVVIRNRPAVRVRANARRKDD